MSGADSNIKTWLSERRLVFQVENDRTRTLFDIEFVITRDEQWARDTLGVVVDGAATGPLAEIQNGDGFIEHLLSLGAKEMALSDNSED